MQFYSDENPRAMQANGALSSVSLRSVSSGRQDEKGAVLAFFGVILTAIIVVASFTIDQGRAMFAHRKMENLADAIALASVNGLDGTSAGWGNSKRMLIRTLQRGDLSGIYPANLETVTGFNAGALIDNHESDPELRMNKVLIGDRLEVSIERGLHGTDGFRSLEGIPTAFGVPTPLIANAVKVRVTLYELGTPLANIAVGLSSGGSSSFPEFEEVVGESIAIRDRDPSVSVAPFAIPACYLLTNLNPFSSQGYQDDQYSGMANCQREVIARSPEVAEVRYETGAGHGSSSKRKLVEGMMRSDTYPRPPLVDYSDAIGSDAAAESTASLCFRNPVNGQFPTGLHMNCKALPIRAFLGVPDSATNDPISADELSSFIGDARMGILKAQVGSNFRPVADRSYLDHGGLRMALLDFINDSNNPSFRDVFYAGGAPATNFPWRRNLVAPNTGVDIGSSGYRDPLVELKLQWPESVAGNTVNYSMFMQDAGDYGSNALVVPGVMAGQNSYRFTNPMCHTAGIAHDHDLASKVRRINVMVLGSETDEYCDMSSTFQHMSQTAQPPRSFTNPKVIGFVEANVFDFRIDRFPENEPVEFPAAHGIPKLEDQNPYSLDFFSSNPQFAAYAEALENYEEDNNDYEACSECVDNGFPAGECDDFSAVESGDETCGDRPEPPAPPSNASWINECFERDFGVESMLERINQLEPYETPEVGGFIGEDPGITSSKCTLTRESQCVPSCREFCGGSRAEFKLDESAYWDVKPVQGLGVGARVVWDPELVLAPYRDIDGNLTLTTDEEVAAALESGQAQYREYDEDGNIVPGSEKWVDLQSEPWVLEVFEGHDAECIETLRGTGVCGFDMLEHQLNDTFVAPPSLPGGDAGWCSAMCDAAPTGRLRQECNDYCTDAHSARDDQIRIDAEEEVANRRANNQTLWDNIRANIQAIVSLIRQERINQLSGQNLVATGFSASDFMYAKDGKHCLPRKLNDCDDIDSPSCWESPKHRDAGWGCAGVRMRLSCESDTFISPTGQVADMRPALVE